MKDQRTRDTKQGPTHTHACVHTSARVQIHRSRRTTLVCTHRRHRVHTTPCRAHRCTQCLSAPPLATSTRDRIAPLGPPSQHTLPAPRHPKNTLNSRIASNTTPCRAHRCTQCLFQDTEQRTCIFRAAAVVWPKVTSSRACSCAPWKTGMHGTCVTELI